MDRSLFLHELTRRNEAIWLNDTYPTSGNPSTFYVTRDVLTSPPTVVKIILSSPVEVNYQYRVEETGEYIVSLKDLELTAGWVEDRRKSPLDICFMHSFGKCFGKTKEKDSSTCHQIHIKRDVLDAMRRTYTLNQRRYFCRTMKANIDENVSQKLWNLVHKRLSLQYLEFKTEDIDVTAGSTTYEVEYRKWLLSLASHSTLKGDQNSQCENYYSTTNLCPEYAVLGRCSKGASCQNIHGLLVNSLSKHRYVKIALREIQKIDESPNLEGQQRHLNALEQQAQGTAPLLQLYPNQRAVSQIEFIGSQIQSLPYSYSDFSPAPQF